MGRKEAKATTLTPVGVEPGGPLAGLRDAPFPYDGPEFILPAIDRAVKEVEFIMAGLNALRAAYGGAVPEPVATVEEAVKVKESEADARAAAIKVKLEGEAQKAAVFASHDEPVEEPPAAVGSGWVCTEHGDKNIVELTSRANRKYRACKAAGCRQFQKPGE